MTSKYIVEANDGNFDKEVIEKSKKVIVVVDFWASWCGPCRMLGPVMEKLAEDYKGKFILAKVSVEENSEKPGEYDVSSIPSVKMFKNGKVVDEFVGAIPESRIKEWLDKNLK
ncbi:MAG: thioredoxin [Candidatus Pacearchaeota archaeon]|jgi:putative thioredoxin